MALHTGRLPNKPEPKQESAHCRFCTKVVLLGPPSRRKHQQGDTAGDVCCFRCLHKIGCVLCGRELQGRHLDKHQNGTKCPEESIEHVLIKAGWERTGTLSRSLKSRGFSVRYVPRWVALPELIETPVSHHRERWKYPALPAVEPPEWPETDLREAVERLERLAVLRALKGR